MMNMYYHSEDGVVSTDEVKDGEPALNIKKVLCMSVCT